MGAASTELRREPALQVWSVENQTHVGSSIVCGILSLEAAQFDQAAQGLLLNAIKLEQSIAALMFTNID